MIQLLIFYVAKAALLLGLTALLARLLHKARPATRHIVWLAGFGGAFLVLPLSFLLPALHLGLIPSRAAGVGLNLLVVLALAGAAALMVRLAIDHIALSRLAARTETVTDERLVAMAHAAAAELGVRRSVRLRRWDGPTPAMFGTLRPTVLLPAGAESWPEQRIKLVLLHELAHVARSDAASMPLARLVAAMHWFNPFAWRALRRLRAECEQACDDLVLRTGADPVGYARTLIEALQDGRAGPAPAGALAMTVGEQIEARLARILESSAARSPRWGWTLAAAGVAMAVAVLLLAPLTAGSGADSDYSAVVR
jgi:beta-lactamase regulating signal transducer with metallopeptidase domain